MKNEAQPTTHDGLITDQAPDSFRITDAKSANWLVRKITELRAYRDRVKEWAEQELHRAAEDEKRLLYIFGTQLQTWAEAEIARSGGQRKSVNLPAGRVGYRTLGSRLVIDNAEAVVQWAKSNCPDAVIVKESLDKEKLNTLLEETGEVPDAGAHVEAAREKFFVE